MHFSSIFLRPHHHRHSLFLNPSSRRLFSFLPPHFLLIHPMIATLSLKKNQPSWVVRMDMVDELTSSYTS
ncbi:hypothetical protein Patl1_06102 [Pistacia atlantica]|uniref:Uncharacterized protein n=1 Tax=Pistacia atlantica TaxID=434234 RepID=A0ACC1BQH2_9ROSI|nr:hypothetical protein Patl1_06102 [Pistacia atlantica]